MNVHSIWYFLVLAIVWLVLQCMTVTEAMQFNTPCIARQKNWIGLLWGV
jgi:hypothetical protein